MSIEERRNYEYRSRAEAKRTERLNHPERYFARRTLVGLAALAAFGAGVITTARQDSPQRIEQQTERRDDTIEGLIESERLTVIEARKGQDHVVLTIRPGDRLSTLSASIAGPSEDPRKLTDQFVAQLESKGTKLTELDHPVEVLVPEEYAQPVREVYSQLELGD